jgi:hypothetical protein
MRNKFNIERCRTRSDRQYQAEIKAKIKTMLLNSNINYRKAPITIILIVGAFFLYAITLPLYFIYALITEAFSIIRGYTKGFFISTKSTITEWQKQ